MTPQMSTAQLTAFYNLCMGLEAKEEEFAYSDPETNYHMARGMWLVTKLDVPHPVDFIKGETA